jgi:hypothetical protein
MELMHHHLSFFFQIYLFIKFVLPIKKAALKIEIILTKFLAFRLNLLVLPVNNAQSANIPPKNILFFKINSI